jgi:hypothetical protein
MWPEKQTAPGENFFFDSCHVVDRENWECSTEASRTGMKNGRAYTLTNPGWTIQGGVRYQSSLTGPIEWAFDNQLIDLRLALKLQGAPMDLPIAIAPLPRG